MTRAVASAQPTEDVTGAETSDKKQSLQYKRSFFVRMVSDPKIYNPKIVKMKDMEGEEGFIEEEAGSSSSTSPVGGDKGGVAAGNGSAKGGGAEPGKASGWSRARAKGKKGKG